MDEIYRSPTYGIDTGYAERFDFGTVESDYLFNYVQSASFHHVLPGPGGYYLHWAIEIPNESVIVVRDPEIGRYGAVFIASIEISALDDPETVLYDDRAESFFAVSEEEAAALGQPFLFRGVVPVIPGSHHLRIVVRNRACPSRDEAECRRAYTLLEGPIEVPELQFETPELTDPVLAYGSDLLGGDPLYRGYRFGRRSIRPNPSSVFAAGTTLYLLSEPLNAPEDARVEWTVAPDPAALFGDEPPAPISGTVAAGGDRDGPLVVSQPLGRLPGGRYVAGVRLLAGDGRELARRSTPFQVSPRATLARPLVDGGLGEIRPELAGAPELVRARQWEAAANPAMARAFAEEAVRVGPNYVPARELLAQYLLEGDAPAEAATLLRSGLRGVPRPVRHRGAARRGARPDGRLRGRPRAAHPGARTTGSGRRPPRAARHHPSGAGKRGERGPIPRSGVRAGSGERAGAGAPAPVRAKTGPPELFRRSLRPAGAALNEGETMAADLRFAASDFGGKCERGLPPFTRK